MTKNLCNTPFNKYKYFFHLFIKQTRVHDIHYVNLFCYLALGFDCDWGCPQTKIAVWGSYGPKIGAVVTPIFGHLTYYY